MNLGRVVLSGGDLIAVDRTKTCFWLACGDLGGDSVSVFRMFDGGFVDLGGSFLGGDRIVTLDGTNAALGLGSVGGVAGSH
ncbi:MAG: hypothetical protein QOJ95_1283, partial [Mycobacterium sp.]|nr:hypothetical protein [Mycobacterium sp.]